MHLSPPPATAAVAAAVAAATVTAPQVIFRPTTQPRRIHKRLRLLPAALDDATSCVVEPLSALRQWVSDAGGFVDPRLTVSDSAPASGCRGIIAAAPITLDDLEATGPLIAVPQQLQFTGEVALDIIRQAAGAGAADAAAEQLSNTQQIAAALAHELLHNADSSFWQPYLASLPAQPPNPWLLQGHDQVLAALQPFSHHHHQQQQIDSALNLNQQQLTQTWAAATAAARQQQLQAAAEVEALLGAALGISQDDVMTAMGHVTSRSLGSGSSSGMCPVIDLVNHTAAAGAPMLQLDDRDVLVMTVLPLCEGEAVPMAAGDELLIQYKGGYTPLEAFLKFGFVAAEWWHDE